MNRLNVSKFVQHQRNIFIFRHTPGLFGYLYIKAIFKVYYLFKFRERRLIRANIHNFLGGLGWSDRRIRRRIVRQAFFGIFMHYYEKMFSAYKPYPAVRRLLSGPVSVKGLDTLDRALAQGKGVILVTAHWGGVEYIPWALAFRNYPLSVILEYQAEKLREFLKEKNYYFDSVELLNEGEVDSIWKQALRRLRENRIVMTQCDEADKWRYRPGRQIELFNTNLYYDNTIELMAKYSGAQVITAFMERFDRKTYSLKLEAVDSMAPPDIGRLVFKRFEYYLSSHPEQWYQWKKWKKMKVTETDKARLPTRIPASYRAVVFDLDNTLYYAKGLKRQVLLATLNTGIPQLSRLGAFGAARAELAGVGFDHGAALLEELATRAAVRRRSLAERHSGHVPDERVHDYRRWYEQQFYDVFLSTLHRFHHTPQKVDEVLHELKHNNINLFCYSDYSMITDRLEAIGLDPGLFDAVYSGEKLGALKPSVGGIVRAAAETGLDMKSILMVGDRNDTDGASADKAGCDFFKIHTDNQRQFTESWHALGIKLRGTEACA